MITKFDNDNFKNGSRKNFIKQLYNNSIWLRFFTFIRFWTGSFYQLETLVPEKGKILDLGCGYGIFTNYLAVCSRSRIMIGIDIDKHKIAHADKGLKNVYFTVGDATKMNFKNLDCILLLDVLHHLDSYTAQEKLIKDCSKMLERNGVLIISDVDNKPFWKLVLARLTDFIMYKGQPAFYRYERDMIKLLRLYLQEIAVKSLPDNPYPRVVYICK